MVKEDETHILMGRKREVRVRDPKEKEESKKMMGIEVLTPEELKQLERLERIHEASMDEWEQQLIKEGKSPEEAKRIINNYR